MSVATFPQRIAGLLEQSIVEIAKYAGDFDDVVPLWFGESDLPTPNFIVEAAVSAVRLGETFYPDVHGVEALRRAIADYASHMHDKKIGMERVLVTASGMEALALALQALVEPGNEVLIVRPAWQNVVAAAERLGGAVREVHLGLGNDGRWHLQMEKVFAAITPNTRCIVINSPNNPTGWIIDQEAQRHLLSLARERGIWLIFDEVYERLVFDAEAAPSILSISQPDDPVIVVNSFSKAWAMTGWRLGWIVAPVSAISILGRVKEYTSSGVNPFVQTGGIEAIRGGEGFVQSFRSYCVEGRDIVMSALGNHEGILIPKPESTFYAVISAQGVPGGFETCKRLISEFGVGIAPCDAFGGGLNNWFRICFARSPAKLHEGLSRLTRGLVRIAADNSYVTNKPIQTRNAV